MEPNSSLCCTEIGKEAADISCNVGHTHQILGQNYHPEADIFTHTHTGHRVQEFVLIVIPRDKKKHDWTRQEKPDLNLALL